MQINNRKPIITIKKLTTLLPLYRLLFSLFPYLSFLYEFSHVTLLKSILQPHLRFMKRMSGSVFTKFCNHVGIICLI